MSTKSSIKYTDDYHVYYECFDYENIYIELSHVSAGRFRQDNEFMEFEFTVDTCVWQSLNLHKLPICVEHNICVQRSCEIADQTRVTLLINCDSYTIEPSLTQIVIILPQSLYREINQ